MITIILKALYLFLPAYIANIVPVWLAILFSGKKMSTPIDFGKKWHNKRITGDHKTWRGLIGGGLAGLGMFYLQGYLSTHITFFESITTIDYSEISSLMGLFMGLGALIGDCLKSVIKRQMKIPPGKNWIPFDQIDFVIGGIIAMFIFVIPTTEIIFWIIILSFILHSIIGTGTEPVKKFVHRKNR